MNISLLCKYMTCYFIDLLMNIYVFVMYLKKLINFLRILNLSVLFYNYPILGKNIKRVRLDFFKFL
jgi:hypothetical protein